MNNRHILNLTVGLLMAYLRALLDLSQPRFQILDGPITAVPGVGRIPTDVIDTVSLEIPKSLGGGGPALRSHVHADRFSLRAVVAGCAPT